MELKCKGVSKPDDLPVTREALLSWSYGCSHVVTVHHSIAETGSTSEDRVGPETKHFSSMCGYSMKEGQFVAQGSFQCAVLAQYANTRASSFHSLIRSLTHSLTHSLTRSLADWLVKVFAHSLPHLLALTQSLTHALTFLLTHTLTRSLTRSLTPSLTS